MATYFNKSGLKEDSKKVIQKAHELFRVLDKNDNGFINKRDIWRMSDELSLTGEELEEVFTILDRDESEYLTEEEFVQGLASYLGVDLSELKKEAEQETRKAAEEEEDEEYEDLLNRIEELNTEDKADLENLWETLKTKNPKLTTSEFELVMEDLGKEMRRGGDNQEAKKDFFSLHKYYYRHINSVMQHLESRKPNEVKLTSWNSTTLGEQQLPTSPPVKTRNKFLKSSEVPSSSVTERERESSSSKLLHASDHVGNEYCQLHNNYTLTAINTPERLFKVIFVGDSGVGKTSFLHRFCYEKFISIYHATVGIDYRVKTFTVDGHLIAFQLWDTAGQERYQSFCSQYFRKTDGVIFMYDITCEVSFRNVRRWMAHTKEISECNLVSAVVGNKIDLSCTEQQLVPSVNGDELARKHGSLFYETSCKTGEGIWNVMTGLARALQEKEDREIETIYELHKLEESKKCC